MGKLASSQLNNNKTLEYCLPASDLTREDCDKNMQPLIKSFFAKIRFSANFRHSLIHASPEEGGLVFPIFINYKVEITSNWQLNIYTQTQ